MNEEFLNKLLAHNPDDVHIYLILWKYNVRINPLVIVLDAFVGWLVGWSVINSFKIREVTNPSLLPEHSLFENSKMTKTIVLKNDGSSARYQGTTGYQRATKERWELRELPRNDSRSAS